MDYEFLKVKNQPNLMRDPSSNAILNDNQSDYDEYIARRDAVNKEKEKSLNVEEDVANLKSELSEIKSLLKELVNGN
jgi:hypothetical protein|tara:strand:+ start:448 stop:678 length:231 start_codon:yes stop_codon:yes gene_type:complete